VRHVAISSNGTIAVYSRGSSVEGEEGQQGIIRTFTFNGLPLSSTGILNIDSTEKDKEEGGEKEGKKEDKPTTPRSETQEEGEEGGNDGDITFMYITKSEVLITAGRTILLRHCNDLTKVVHHLDYNTR